MSQQCIYPHVFSLFAMSNVPIQLQSSTPANETLKQELPPEINTVSIGGDQAMLKYVVGINDLYWIQFIPYQGKET